MVAFFLENANPIKTMHIYFVPIGPDGESSHLICNALKIQRQLPTCLFNTRMAMMKTVPSMDSFVLKNNKKNK